MRRNILGTAEDIYHINIVRDISQFSVDLLAEDFRDLRIINRDGNNPESGLLHVLWNIESRLARLCFSLDAEHGDPSCLRNQFADLLRVREDVVAPVHDSIPDIVSDARA